MPSQSAETCGIYPAVESTTSPRTRRKGHEEEEDDDEDKSAALDCCGSDAEETSVT